MLNRCICSAAIAFVALVFGASPSAHAGFTFGFGGAVPVELQLTTSTGLVTVPTSVLADGGYSQGWWSATDPNGAGNDNYFVGTLSGDTFNNFFSFDLQNLSSSETVLSATLYLNQFGSESPVGEYALFDVSTPFETLNDNSGTSTSIFDDLGSGVSFGNFAINPANDFTYISLNLNANAVAAINNSIGDYFSIGGTLSPSVGTVPEPTTMIGLAASSVGLLLVRRRRAANRQ
jgi:hypothetical protein